MPSSLSEFNVWNAKIDKIVDDLKAQGVCESEAEALKSAGKNVAHAQRAIDNALNNRSTSGASSILGTLAIGGCALSETGVGTIVCVGATAGLAIMSMKSWIDGGDAVDLAIDDLDDALDDLESAIDAVCRCKMKHGNTEP